MSDSELHPTLRPTVARGHNIVLVVPPSPAYAMPVFAGLAERPAAPMLLLAPAAERDEWGTAALAGANGALPVHVAHGTARAQRRLRAGEPGLLVADPDTALALLGRSALHTDQLGAVVLAWPERYRDDEALTALMHDLSKETQRVVVTADPGAATELVERYARKALTLGLPPAETPAREQAGPVRTVTASWRHRAAAVAEVLELLDPARAAVWAADPSAEAAVRRAVSLGDAVRFSAEDAPEADLVIAYDLPTRERLEQLLGAGDVALLVPPGTERYVERIAAPRRPLRLPGLLETVAAGAAAERAAIVKQLESGTPERAVHALAPLFERHDPAVIAAALYELWRAGPGAAVAGAPASEVPATARVWVNVGRNDEATPNDLVAVLTKEVRVDRAKIGRIEIRDAFSLIELPTQEAERIAAAMTGLSVRRKRLAARLDRGAGRPAEGGRAPGRGAGGPRPGGPRPGGSRPGGSRPGGSRPGGPRPAGRGPGGDRPPRDGPTRA